MEHKHANYRQSILAGLLFLALTTTFHITDPYRTLFFSQATLPHLLHHIGRLLFTFFLFEILFSIGQFPLKLSQYYNPLPNLDPLEEIIISLLCGSAILRIAMLILGFTNLYYWPLLATLATLLAASGWNQFKHLIKLSIQLIKNSWKPTSIVEKYSCYLLLTALVIASTSVILEKFLLPNGTGDYFSHYLPYYQTVIATKNILPNDVWYHFYISKGAGDVFFSILLSDLLGSSTVSCVMFFTGLLIMFNMIKQMTNDVLLSLAATCLIASGFIWTFETNIGFTHWAEFPKQHVITGILFIGAAWASWKQRNTSTSQYLAWTYLTALIYIGLILLRPQFAAISLIFLVLMAAWAWKSKNYFSIRAYFICCVAIIITTLCLLAINYAYTGLAEVTPFRFFWQYANQSKFATWVSPFLMLLLDLGSSPDLGSVAPPNFHQFHFLKLLFAVFRFDRITPLFFFHGTLFILVLSAAIFSIKKKYTPQWRDLTPYICIFSIILLSALTVFFAVNQIGSLYRLYLFCMFPVIALALLPFAIARKSNHVTIRTFSTIVLTFLTIIAVPTELDRIPKEQQNLILNYTIGRNNISDALTSQNAVWKDALKMAAIAGNNTPIWSMQVGYHFCVAPECRLKTFFSFSMDNAWATVMFESPETARLSLEKHGINYFAIDTTTPIFDMLPYSPLFNPDNISKNLQIIWEDNGVYLLTWKSHYTKPLSKKFITNYTNSIHKAIDLADFKALDYQLAQIYAKWKIDSKWPVHIDPKQPKPRGWQ